MGAVTSTLSNQVQFQTGQAMTTEQEVHFQTSQLKLMDQAKSLGQQQTLAQLANIGTIATPQNMAGPGMTPYQQFTYGQTFLSLIYSITTSLSFLSPILFFFCFLAWFVHFSYKAVFLLSFLGFFILFTNLLVNSTYFYLTYSSAPISTSFFLSLTLSILYTFFLYKPIL